MHKLIADNQQLTGTAAVSTSTIQVDGNRYHTLYVMYSPDTDSTNALQVTIEMSPDNVVWHPFTGAYSATTGTATEGAQVTLSLTSNGVADQFHAPYTFTGAAQYLRVKLVETNTPADFGNASIWIFSSRS